MKTTHTALILAALLLALAGTATAADPQPSVQLASADTGADTKPKVQADAGKSGDSDDCD